jgi:hypothetical protein
MINEEGHMSKKHDQVLELLRALADDESLNIKYSHYRQAAIDILDEDKLVWTFRIDEIDYPTDSALKMVISTHNGRGMASIEHNGQVFLIDRFGNSARVYRIGKFYNREYIGCFTWGYD